ncbi:hypothetical protein [Nocardioides sp. MH1]|uniref:hypothetical protein n=1 Tax=Nocardioides sp. MH1 TaxID=3242490 RepID=UPI003522D5BB
MSESPDGSGPARRIGQADREDTVWWFTWLGVVLAAAGLADGIWLATRERIADCPDGKYFPEGTTDLDCYAHPQLGLGIGIAVLSVLLGILVVFASILLRAHLADRMPPEGR